jgi:hypothetical protein
MHALDSLCFNNSPLSPSAQISRGVGGFFQAKNAAEQQKQASSDFSHVHPSKSPAVSHPIYPSIGFTFLLLLQLFFFLLRLGRSLAGCLSAARSPLCYNFFDFPPESRFFSFASCTLSSPHLLHLEKSGLQLSAVATTPADAVTCTSLLGRLQRAGLSHTHTNSTHSHSTDLAAHRRWPGPFACNGTGRIHGCFCCPWFSCAMSGGGRFRNFPAAAVETATATRVFRPEWCRRRPPAVKFQFALAL